LNFPCAAIREVPKIGVRQKSRPFLRLDDFHFRKSHRATAWSRLCQPKKYSAHCLRDDRVMLP
jgi:hypothetical protein